MNKCNFSYNHYKEVFKEILNKEYNIVDFEHCGIREKELILRHDIDVDLKKALELAKIEFGLGIKANYFFWLTSPFYNIFDDDNREIVNKIIYLGHNVGVHFNENIYNCINENQLEKCINKELDVFKILFGFRPKVISFHMPSKHLLNNDFQFKNIINAYHSKFFKGYKYLSDSEMRWREGCICKNLKSDKYNKIQILIHPIWWSEDNKDIHQIVKNFYMNKKNILNKNWNKHIKVC